MTTVTKLLLQSGDRAALDGVVDSIRATARRKGAEFKGPHSEAPTDHRVARYKRLDGEDGAYDPWNYTVYSRRIEIVGHDELAGFLLDQSFPDSVHVEVELEQVRSVGR